jgi:D-arabinose 1-dehydrogenase-like Zn-dependent alcohol dehydrogenase
VTHDLGWVETRGERVEHHGHQHAGALEAGLAVTDGRIDGDQLERVVVHGSSIPGESRPASAAPTRHTGIKALGGADAAISLAVSPKAFEQAYGSLRRGGTLVFVGLLADNDIRLPIFETVLNGTKVVGSIVGTRRDSAMSST